MLFSVLTIRSFSEGDFPNPLESLFFRAFWTVEKTYDITPPSLTIQPDMEGGGACFF